MVSRRTMIPLFVVGTGCGADPASTGKDAAGPGWTDPAADDDWSDLIEPLPATTDAQAADVEAGIAAAFARGVPSAKQVLVQYMALVEGGDEGCPGSAMAGGFEVHGSCTTESGVTFSGVAGLNLTDDRSSPDDDWTGRVEIMTAPADFVITRPDGTRLQAGGVLRYTEQRDFSVQWSSQVAGTWSDGAAEGWLGDGFSGELYVQGDDRGGTDRWLALSGAYSVGDATLGMDELVLSDRDCPDGIFQGRLGLRMVDGQWVTLVFDRCGSCTEATLDDGSSLGSVCIDRAQLETAFDSTRGMP